MKLYILKPIAPWKPWYDTCAGMIVRAPNVDAARTIASASAADEGSNVWLDATFTTCTPIGVRGYGAELILRDCHWA